MTTPNGNQSSATADTAPRRLIVISAGTSEPSSTRMLAERISRRTLEVLRETGVDASAAVIELAPLAVDIAGATVAGFPSERLQAAIEQIAGADAIIAATPVYKAGISGLFKSFVDVLDDDLLIAKPVLLAATAGSSRHALVADEQMRPLFAYMRALTLPTSVFAGPEDLSAPELGDRIGRAATELAVLITAQIERQITDRQWSGYQHRFAGNATHAERTTADVDFDSPLMRLAAGGRT
ncbi:MAG: CE1759 family FMN reductase [Solirubrobacteraceae bacterium]